MQLKLTRSDGVFYALDDNYSELLEGISTTHTLLTEQKTSCDYTLLHFSRALTERTKSGLTTHLQHLVLGFISKKATQRDGLALLHFSGSSPTHR